MLPIYLSFKEMWRNQGRFLLFSLVIALITVLVLFIAALADGLGNGNREYIEKLNADLIVYKSDVALSITASQLGREKLLGVSRVPGVTDAGQVSFSSTVVRYQGAKELNVSLIGVGPGKPGEPPVVQGRGLQDRQAKETIIDRNVALTTGLRVGDNLTIKSIQGAKEKLYTLKVVGISDGRQFFLQPSVIVPDLTFEQIKPGAVPTGNASDLISNIIVVQLQHPSQWKQMESVLASQVSGIQAVDKVTAYENTPGYAAQQSTLGTQQFFSLLIGVLVIGGFFQIQMLQKVPQIGMLKAVGASSPVIALSALAQIVMVTVIGVAIGTAATLLMALTFPATIPIVFSPMAIVLGVVSILLIGPLGGLVSIRYALRVEPLTALGLSS
jgi:putative ABC transport system permease protein